MQEMTDAKTAVKELTMLLMYLTRFDEHNRFYSSSDVAWKSYDFNVIAELVEEELIDHHKPKSKTVTIRDGGLAWANELLAKYHITIEGNP